MKKFYIIVFVTLIANISVLYGKTPQREIKSLESKIERFEQQKASFQTKLDKAQSDYEEATAKVEELAEKPNSPAYKTALRKKETSSIKADELQQSIANVEHQIDSLQNIIVSYQQEAEDVSQEEMLEEISQEETVISSDINYERNDGKNDERVTKNEDKSSMESNKEPSEPMAKWKQVLLIIVVILVGLIWFWLELRFQFRCPNCGRWFTFHKDGVKVLNRQVDPNSKGSWIISYRRSWRCSNCNHVKTQDGKYHSSRKDLPTDWY